MVLFGKKSCSNLVNQYVSLWEKYWLTKDWRGGFMTPFHSTSKADLCVLKIPCVLKIFSKPRSQRKSPATGVSLCSCSVYQSITTFRPILTKWSHAVPALIHCHELGTDATLSMFPVTYKWVMSHMTVINHVGIMWEMSHAPCDCNCNQSYGKIIWDTWLLQSIKHDSLICDQSYTTHLL